MLDFLFSEAVTAKIGAAFFRLGIDVDSDMKDVSYFFNFKFYEKVIEKGGLK